MGRNKKWSGYTSWSYLEPKRDYDVYPLNKQIDRVPKYNFGLSKSQEEHVEEILAKNIIVDLHEHIEVAPLERPHFPPRRMFKAYEGLAASGIDAVFSNDVASTWDEAIRFLGQSMCDFAHQDFLVPALKINDVTSAFEKGKVAVIHTIEQASAIDRDIDKIDLLYGFGARSMGLVYSESNTLGSGLNEILDGGLTDIGYDAVKRMNKTGIIIDVSHCGDITSKQAIEASDKPVLISHRGSRTLTTTTRMLPDETLKACAERGGVIGLEVAGFGLWTKKHPESTIEGLLEQVEYLVDLLGSDHVGIGPDSGFSDHAAGYREAAPARGHYVRQRPKGPVQTHAEWRASVVKDLDYVKGLENPVEFSNVIRGLIRDGLSDAEIAKVMGQNGLRVIKACWPL